MKKKRRMGIIIAGLTIGMLVVLAVYFPFGRWVRGTPKVATPERELSVKAYFPDGNYGHWIGDIIRLRIEVKKFDRDISVNLDSLPRAGQELANKIEVWEGKSPNPVIQTRKTKEGVTYIIDYWLQSFLPGGFEYKLPPLVVSYFQDGKKKSLTVNPGYIAISRIAPLFLGVAPLPAEKAIGVPRMWVAYVFLAVALAGFSLLIIVVVKQIKIKKRSEAVEREELLKEIEAGIRMLDLIAENREESPITPGFVVAALFDKIERKDKIFSPSEADYVKKIVHGEEIDAKDAHRFLTAILERISNNATDRRGRGK